MQIVEQDTVVPLKLTVIDGASGGVLGLSPTARIRDAATTNSYLDFNDNTFKTVGWTTQDQALTEIGDGTYDFPLDLSALPLSGGEALAVEFRDTTSDTIDSSEMLLVAPISTIGVVVTVIDGASGGVTGLTMTVKARDGSTTDSYLDFADGTFKTAGWTTQEAAMSDLGRGHYHASIDGSTVTTILEKNIVFEYHADGPPEIDGTDFYALHDLATAGSFQIVALQQPQFGIPLADRLQFLTDQVPNGSDSYVALFTTLPNRAGVGGVEATGSGYARVAHNAWVNGVVADFIARRRNVGQVTFPALTDDLTVIGWGIYDAAVAGNLRAFGVLRNADSQPRVFSLASGDQPQFLSGELQFGIQ